MSEFIFGLSIFANTPNTANTKQKQKKNPRIFSSHIYNNFVNNMLI